MNPLAEQILKAIGGHDVGHQAHEVAVGKENRVEQLPLPPAVLREVKETLREGRASRRRAGLESGPVGEPQRPATEDAGLRSADSRVPAASRRARQSCWPT